MSNWRTSRAIRLKLGLSGQEIYDVLSKKLQQFTDVYSVDKIDISTLQERVGRGEAVCCVVNTATSREPEGEHWVAIYMTKPLCSYFDPLSFPPLQRPLLQICHLSDSFEWNDILIQDIENPKSTACGYFCIFFLLMKSNGLSMNNIVETYFTPENLSMNDSFVITLVEKECM